MISRDKVQNIILMMAIVVLLFILAIAFTENENLEAQLSYKPEPVIVKGEYTIIHYPSGGWANAIHITEYKLDEQVLWYREKDSAEDKPIWFNSVLLADGWLEGEQLMDYGFWVSEDIGL